MMKRFGWKIGLIVASTILGLALVGIFNNKAAAQTMETCHPVSERTQELGCWIVADSAIGQLTASQAFWHLDTYPTREAAAAYPWQAAPRTKFRGPPAPHGKPRCGA